MSPRPGPPRILVAFRIAASGLAAVDELAEAEGVGRSTMIRTLIGEAVAARQAKAARRAR